MPVRHAPASLALRNPALVNLALTAGASILPSGRVRFDGLNSRQHHRALQILTGTLTEWRADSRHRPGCDCCREGGEVTVRQEPTQQGRAAAIWGIARIQAEAREARRALMPAFSCDCRPTGIFTCGCW